MKGQRKDKGNKCFTKSLSFLVMLACVRRYDEVLASKMVEKKHETRRGEDEESFELSCDGCRVQDCAPVYICMEASCLQKFSFAIDSSLSTF